MTDRWPQTLCKVLADLCPWGWLRNALLCVRAKFPLGEAVFRVLHIQLFWAWCILCKNSSEPSASCCVEISDTVKWKVCICRKFRILSEITILSKVIFCIYIVRGHQCPLWCGKRWREVWGGMAAAQIGIVLWPPPLVPPPNPPTPAVPLDRMLKPSYFELSPSSVNGQRGGVQDRI